jgi:hypothetical protein
MPALDPGRAGQCTDLALRTHDALQCLHPGCFVQAQINLLGDSPTGLAVLALRSRPGGTYAIHTVLMYLPPGQCRAVQVIDPTYGPGDLPNDLEKYTGRLSELPIYRLDDYIERLIPLYEARTPATHLYIYLPDVSFTRVLPLKDLDKPW